MTVRAHCARDTAETLMTGLIDWIAALDPASAFLFALPFVIAAAALVAERVKRTSRRASRDASRAGAPGPRHGHRRAWG